MDKNYEHKYFKYLSKINSVYGGVNSKDIIGSQPGSSVIIPKQSQSKWIPKQDLSRQRKNKPTNPKTTQARSTITSTVKLDPIVREKNIYNEIMNEKFMSRTLIEYYIKEVIKYLIPIDSFIYNYQNNGVKKSIDMSEIINKNIKNLLVDTPDSLPSALANMLYHLPKDNIALCISLFGTQLQLMSKSLGHPNLSIQVMALEEFVDTKNIKNNEQWPHVSIGSIVSNDRDLREIAYLANYVNNTHVHDDILLAFYWIYYLVTNQCITDLDYRKLRFWVTTPYHGYAGVGYPMTTLDNKSYTVDNDGYIIGEEYIDGYLYPFSTFSRSVDSSCVKLFESYLDMNFGIYAAPYHGQLHIKDKTCQKCPTKIIYKTDDYGKFFETGIFIIPRIHYGTFSY